MQCKVFQSLKEVRVAGRHAVEERYKKKEKDMLVQSTKNNEETKTL